MSEPESTTSPLSVSAILLVVAAFLCGGVPALVICGGIGASFWDVLGNFGAQ